MKKLSFLHALFLGTLFHPTATFAMDSKVAAKTTGGIVAGIEKLFSGNLDSEVDEVVEGRRGGSQPAFSSSSSDSRSRETSFVTLLEPSTTVTNSTSKTIQNLDDVRALIGQIIKNTLDEESSGVNQTNFCDNKHENTQVIIAVRVASRIASRVSFPFNPNSTISKYVSEYISEYISEYNKRISEYIFADTDSSSTNVKSDKEDDDLGNTLLYAREDVLQDILENNDLNTYRTHLQSVLNVHNVSKEAAKDALTDISEDLSQDQKRSRISFRDQGNVTYINQYASNYACQYAESAALDIEHDFSYDEWFNAWVSIYRRVIAKERGINTEEERDRTVSDSDTMSIHSYFSEASIDYKEITDNSANFDYRKMELITAKKRRVKAIKKIEGWKAHTPTLSAARDAAKIIITEKKTQYLDSSLFQEVDRAWRHLQEANKIDPRKKGTGGLAGRTATIVEAENKLREARRVASEEYLNRIIDEFSISQKTVPFISSIEAVMSEIFWREKKKKEIIWDTTSSNWYSNVEEWKNQLISKANRTVFESIWSDAVNEEEDRSQRINQIRDKIFNAADQAWADYIKPREAPEDLTYANAQALEEKACQNYAKVILKEAVEAAKSTNSKAAEGAWVVRVEISAEAVVRAAKKKIDLNESTIRTMFFNIAPWMTSASFKAIFNDPKNRSILLETAELSMTNIPGSEAAWADTVPLFDPTISYNRTCWLREHNLNDECSIWAKARVNAEAEYRNGVIKLDRAIAIAEADLAAWKAAWPEEFQKTEADQAISSSLSSDLERQLISQHATSAVVRSKNALTKAQEAEKEGCHKVAHVWYTIAEDLEVAREHWQNFHIAYTQGNQDKMKLFKEMASTIEKDVESLEKHVQSLIQKEEDWAKEDPENRLIEMEEKEGLCSGQKIRTTILKTKFIYPFIRQEEVIDTTTGKILNKVEMVADHLLVRLKEEESEKEFLHNLELYLKQKKFSYSEMKLKKISSNPSLYQLDFSTTFQSGSSLLAIMANIIEVVKSNKLAQSCNPDFLMSSFSDPDDPLYEKQVSLNPQFDYGIQAPHNLFSSTNPAIPIPTNPANSIIIAIIDSGITPNHEDLIDNIISARDASGRLSFYGFDALEENPLLKYRPRDMSGHGTHCSGIIAASVNNKTGIAGMAGVPGMVKLLACNCFDRTTKKASCTHAINCIDYARRNGARILNCSWGRPQSSDESSIGFSNNGCQDLENAFKKQPKKPCVVITAAGNSGSNNNNFPIYPANYVLSNLVTVAATTYTGTGLWVGLKKASNFGKETVHLAAPGHDILSTWPRPVLQGSGKPSIPYQYKSGTSMAAPHITATLALMMLKFPDLSENEIIKRLFRTSDQEPLIKTKYGRLNLTQALTSYDIEGSKDDESSNSNDELLLWGTKPKHSICDK